MLNPGKEGESKEGKSQAQDASGERKGSFLVSAMNKSNQNKEQVVITSMEIRPPVISFADIETEKKDFAFKKAEYAYKLMASQKGDLKYFKDVSKYLKEQFDAEFGGCWNVVVGRNYGAFVSYESKNIIQFWINDLGFLIYKFG